MYTNKEAFAYTHAITNKDPARCLRVFYPGDIFVQDDNELESEAATARSAGVPHFGWFSAGETAHKVFVDIGSGTGQQSFVIKQLCPWADVYAINLFESQSMLREDHGVHTIFGDATNAWTWATIPEKVDGIILSHVLGHMELNTDYSLFLANRLKAGGRIVIQDITPRHCCVGKTLPIFGDYCVRTTAEVFNWMAYAGLTFARFDVYTRHAQERLTASIREVTTKEQQTQILRDVCGFEMIFELPYPDKEKTEELTIGEDINAPVA